MNFIAVATVNDCDTSKFNSNLVKRIAIAVKAECGGVVPDNDSSQWAHSPVDAMKAALKSLQKTCRTLKREQEFSNQPKSRPRDDVDGDSERDYHLLLFAELCKYMEESKDSGGTNQISIPTSDSFIIWFLRMLVRVVGQVGDEKDSKRQRLGAGSTSISNHAAASQPPNASNSTTKNGPSISYASDKNGSTVNMGIPSLGVSYTRRSENQGTTRHTLQTSIFDSEPSDQPDEDLSAAIKFIEVVNGIQSETDDFSDNCSILLGALQASCVDIFAQSSSSNLTMRLSALRSILCPEDHMVSRAKLMSNLASKPSLTGAKPTTSTGTNLDLSMTRAATAFLNQKFKNQVTSEQEQKKPSFGSNIFTAQLLLDLHLLGDIIGKTSHLPPDKAAEEVIKSLKAKKSQLSAVLELFQKLQIADLRNPSHSAGVVTPNGNAGPSNAAQAHQGRCMSNNFSITAFHTESEPGPGENDNRAAALSLVNPGESTHNVEGPATVGQGSSLGSTSLWPDSCSTRSQVIDSLTRFLKVVMPSEFLMNPLMQQTLNHVLDTGGPMMAKECNKILTAWTGLPQSLVENGTRLLLQAVQEKAQRLTQGQATVSPTPEQSRQPLAQQVQESSQIMVPQNQLLVGAGNGQTTSLQQHTNPNLDVNNNNNNNNINHVQQSLQSLQNQVQAMMAIQLQQDALRGQIQQTQTTGGANALQPNGLVPHLNGHGPGPGQVIMQGQNQAQVPNMIQQTQNGGNNGQHRQCDALNVLTGGTQLGGIIQNNQVLFQQQQRSVNHQNKNASGVNAEAQQASFVCNYTALNSNIHSAYRTISQPPPQ